MESSPHLTPRENLVLRPEFLSSESFAAFGDVVACPLRPDINQIPSLSAFSKAPCIPVIANQNTALKYGSVSRIEDKYAQNGRRAAAPQMSLFSCFPRDLRRSNGKDIFDVRVLERHPYTTQSFFPMGLSGKNDAPSYFLIIVAPSLHGQTAVGMVRDAQGTERETVVENPPVLIEIKAFIARGNQGVTYAPGTWHAPMVVLGSERVDFAVAQFANGVASDDCQEVTLNDGIVVEAQPAESRLWDPRTRTSRL
ncbi:hypothetical protein KEM54_004454 [Ascosphaera aggregata]|nr:hypothetical protein KEM54_004454 [Ascosphaera aggregata]